MDSDLRTLSVNPFYHRVRCRQFGILKLILGGIFLFPIRLIVSIFLLCLTWIIARFCYYIVLLCFPVQVYEKRHIYTRPSVFLLRAIFFVVGFHVNIIDKSLENDPERKNKSKNSYIIVAAPHSAMTDILAYIMLGCPSIVAKKEAIQIPFFGFFLMLTQPILVDRDSPDSRRNTIDSIKKVALERDVFIFPEGTCTNRSSLINFKVGGFIPGLPIRPVAIDYHCCEIDDFYSWTWDGPNSPKLLFLLLCKWRSCLTITLLPVYVPSEVEKTNPKLFAQNVRYELAKELSLPTSDYSFDDIFYMNITKINKIPRSPVCLKLIKLCCKIRSKLNIVEESKNNKNEDLLRFVSEFIRNALNKIGDNLVREIKNRENLLEILDLNRYNSAEDCSVTDATKTADELTTSLGLGCAPALPTYNDLRLLLLLCDYTSSFDLWARIEKWHRESPKDQQRFPFRVIIWQLLGIELSLNDTARLYQNATEVSIAYLRNNLSDLFTKAYKQNLPFLP